MVTATGTVAPRDEAELSFKIGGVVARIAVDAGDRVRKGQTLAMLDLAEIDAAVARARSAADKAERDLARATRLHADSVVSRVELENAGTAAEVARADLQAAAFNRRYAVITAPADGVVLRRSAEPGEMVAAGQPIVATGSDARGSVLNVALSDRDVAAVRLGDPAEAEFAARPGERFLGRVTRIAAAADPMTGAYPVEIALDGSARLPAGLVGDAAIRTPAGAAATLVPVEAVLEADGTEATVFTLDANGRAERRRVSVGALQDGWVAARGLDGAQLAVTDGAAYLEDGDSVEVTR